MKLNWGWRIAIVYTMFALGTLSFVGFALTKDVDLVRADYYEQGLRHDAHARATARAQGLQPKPSVQVDAAAGVLQLTLPSTMAGTAVAVEMYCPSRLDADRKLNLTVDTEGQAKMSIKDHAAAPYVLTASWTFGGQAFRFQQPLTLQ